MFLDKTPNRGTVELISRWCGGRKSAFCGLSRAVSSSGLRAGPCINPESTLLLTTLAWLVPAYWVSLTIYIKKQGFSNDFRSKRWWIPCFQQPCLFLRYGRELVPDQERWHDHLGGQDLQTFEEPKRPGPDGLTWGKTWVSCISKRWIWLWSDVLKSHCQNFSLIPFALLFRHPFRETLAVWGLSLAASTCLVSFRRKLLKRNPWLLSWSTI